MSIRKKLFSQQLEQEQNDVFLIIIYNPVHQKTKVRLDEISQRVKQNHTKRGFTPFGRKTSFF